MMRKISLILAMLVIFFIPWEAISTVSGLGTFSKFVGLLLAATWLAMVIVTGRIRRLSLFHLAAFLFVIWNGLSIYWSNEIGSTIDRVMTYIQLFVLIVIFWDLFSTRENILTGLQMYILGAYVAIGNTLFNFFSGESFSFQRFSASGTNPNDLGGVLALGIPVAWYLITLNNPNRSNKLFNLLNITFIPAALLVIILSGGRAALIATVPGIIFGIVSIKRLKLSRKIVIIIFLISVTVVIMPIIPNYSFERFSTIESEFRRSDLGGRIDIWRDGFKSFVGHPIFGVGSNMYRSINSAGKVAHNTFMSILVELGLVGMTLFGMLLGIVIYHVLHMSKEDSGFWISEIITWVLIASSSSFEHRKVTWLFLILLVGTGALAKQVITRSQPVREYEPNVQISDYEKDGKLLLNR